MPNNGGTDDKESILSMWKVLSRIITVLLIGVVGGECVLATQQFCDAFVLSLVEGVEWIGRSVG